MSPPRYFYADAAAQEPNDADRSFDLMVLLLLGCLGGLVGQPVGFIFRDFTPDVVSGIWARVARWFKPDQVTEVWTQVDVQRLRSRLHEVRVIFVFQSRKSAQLANVLAWMIEQRRSCGIPLPAVMVIYDDSVEENPGATILVSAKPEFSRAVGCWLHRTVNEPWPWSIVAAPIAVPETHDLLDAIQEAATKDNIPLALAELRLLAGILNGQLTRQIIETGGKPVTADAATYEQILRHLSHPLLRQAAEPVDDLTRVMLRRANAYLSARAGVSVSRSVPVGARSSDASTNDARPKKSDSQPATITMVELVNLGNSRSKEFAMVLSALEKDNKALQDIGIALSEMTTAITVNTRSPPARLNPSTVNLKRTTTWSFKQVRTRFERLRKGQLIEARRRADNGPYEYVLPDELLNDCSQFIKLPTVEHVRQALARRSETGLPRQPGECPHGGSDRTP